MPADDPLKALAESARLQLGLRRRVDVVVTAQVASPAVMGILGPRLLLPPRVATELAPAELRLVLLHELVHLRRGDVLVGWLVAIAQALHWFNPLLRWSFARMRELRELACDQSVLELVGGGHRRQYGHTILRVLELLEDRPHGAAPAGVAGMAFWNGKETDSLEERIRMIARVSPRRRGRTIFAAGLALLLAVVGLTDAQEPGQQEPRPWPQPSLRPADRGRTQAKGRAVPQTATSPEPVVNAAYAAEDLVPIFRTARQGDEAGARRHILDWVRQTGEPESWDVPGRGIDWADGRLVVRHTAEVHKRIAGALARVRKCGLEQIVIDVKLVTAPEELIQSLSANWRLQPARTQTTASDVRGGGRARAVRAVASMTTVKQLPVLLEFLDELDAKEVLDTFQQHRRANVHSSPTLAVLNGQPASLFTGSQRPFVVGVAEGQPQIQTFDEGTRMRLCPLLTDDATVWLDCELQLPRIRGVETAVIRPRGAEPVTLQIPEVETTSLRTTTSLPLERTLMLGGLKAQKTKDGWQSLVLLVRASKVSEETARPVTRATHERKVLENPYHGEIPNPALPDGSPAILPQPLPASQRAGRYETQARSARPTAAPRAVKSRDQHVYAVTYAVADLVVPVPRSVIIGGTRRPAEPPIAKADFETLIRLIETTVAPDTWDAAGGPGSMAPFENNLSLVVRQTAEVHEQLADLLEQLRRLQDVQVQIEMHILRLSPEAFKKANLELEDGLLILGKEQADQRAALLTLAEQDQRLQFPRVTLFNGQAGEMDSSPRLLFRPVVIRDRRAVRLSLTVGAESALDALMSVRSALVPDGGTLVLEIGEHLAPEAGVPILSKLPHQRRLFRNTAKSDDWVLLVATPRVIVAEEEEARLLDSSESSMVPPADQFRRSFLAPVGTTTARVIVQEEEEKLLHIPLILEEEEELLGIPPAPPPAAPSDR
jgi:type II secretory pathway component GspD/PulD (secretin)